MSELREALDEAWESGQVEEQEDVETPEDVVTGEDIGGDDDGEPAEIPEEEQLPEAAEKEAEPEVAEQKEAATPKSDKAPASWSPKARENWKNLPKEAKQQINKREQQINKVLQDTAQARKGMQTFAQMMQPHQQRLMSQGYQDPMAAVNTLLATEQQLSSGTTEQKANMIANLIQQYGVDIGTLDSILSGNPQVMSQKQSDPTVTNMLEEKLAPINQFMEQMAYNQYQQDLIGEQQAQTQVSTFSQNAEFIDAVRMDMADILDMASKRGQQMSLEEAYKRACFAHPEVGPIMMEREQQKSLMGTQDRIAEKKSAQVSLTGRPAGPSSGGGENLSLREQLAEAWESSVHG